MKESHIFLFILFCISTSSFSQEFRLVGSVLDQDKNPIVFANVLLLKTTDSTIVNGTSTDDKGAFIFNSIGMGEYLLKASYIENVSKYKAVNISSDFDAGALIIKESQQLDEVVVTYEKPRLERKVDRLVFNVEKTALADGNIWELLQQTPTVNVVNGVITIKGNRNIGILINGRKINIPESDIINLLSGSSASNVEAIEVITNPPLKYSAEGGMLIDIKMKKNLVAGYNGAIFNNFIQGVFAKNTTGTDHFFKGKKTSFSVNYSFSNDKRISRYTDITNFSENATPASMWTSNQDLTTRRKRHNLSAFFDYDIDDKNALSLSTINVFNPKLNQFSFSETLINNMGGSLFSSFNTINDSDQKQTNTSFYADWVHKLKKQGAEISFGSHFTYYDSKKGQDLDTDFFDDNGNQTGENDFITQSNQKINLYNIETDYITPLGKSTRLKAGLRYAGINSESTISQEGFDRNQPGINPTEAGVFTYDESIYAAYTSFDGKWDLWSLKTGLRAEYTETKGELDTGNGPNEISYLEFFPSIAVQYIPSKKHQYQLSYFRRIERPRYNRINPFQQFISNNSVAEGNPDLLPGTRNWVSAEYTLNRDYSIALFYLKWNNPYRQQTFQDNTNNLLRFISMNIESNSGYGIDLTINKDISKAWGFYLFLSAYNNEERFRDLDTGRILSNELWSGFIRLNNGFTFLKDRSLVTDLNFAYYAPRVRGNARTDSYNYLDFRLRKTFWNKNASASFGVQDIFNQGNRFTSRNYLNQNNSTLHRQENRLVTIGFRYKFGNTRIRGNKKSKRVEERRRI
ncbi:TonB-dependent receptor [Maribacter algarum]|uniref:TonB-dependent receptor n=1 Tax=Maribacter algarum (ex Zhang et al. 2020) TaxID=2578118 RepID=A0A5S3PVI6_9FLAO|nr:outer membrane beta-barrel family protein [Maribacter algarum]TMM59026.1 TonB-dependent receptor [Maribacter algarum]